MAASAHGFGRPLLRVEKKAPTPGVRRGASRDKRPEVIAAFAAAEIQTRMIERRIRADLEPLETVLAS